MSTRSLNLGGRAAAAVAVLLLVIAGLALAGIGSGPMSLFAAEDDTAPCSTDNTVPGTDTTDIESTDSTVPCLFGVDTTTSTGEGSSTTGPLDTTPTPATTEPGTNPTNTPPTSRGQDRDGKQTDGAVLALREFRSAAQQWVRCLISGNECGPAPSAADFGLTDEAIAELDGRMLEQVQLRIDRIEQRIACIGALDSPDRPSVAECIGQDDKSERTTTERTERAKESDGEQTGEREQRRGDRTDGRSTDDGRPAERGERTDRGEGSGTRP